MKKIDKKLMPIMVLCILLLGGITFSIIQIVRSAAPDPGHTWSEMGDVAVTVSQGGTGASTLTLNNVILGNSTSAVQFVAPGTTGNVLTSNGTTWASAAPSVPGAFLSRSVLTSGTSFTTSASTSKILIQLVGGGGGGGGATAAASAASVGGGGGSGGYAEKVFTVSPSTAYSYAIGAAGTGGLAANGTGGAGGATSFTVGTAVTANGGSGGVGGASGTTVIFTLGGAGAAVSTNGDLNTTGQPGSDGNRESATIAMTGNGAPSHFGGGGNGRNTAGAGNAGGVYGAGGGGAMSTSATGYAGGAGTAGVIIVWEFD